MQDLTLSSRKEATAKGMVWFSIPSSRVDDIKTALNYVKQGAGQALPGLPLSNPTTRPYGCAIKYTS